MQGQAARGLGRKGFAVRGFRSLHNVPFEFEGEVACARAMAEAGHVECSSATSRQRWELDLDGGWVEVRARKVSNVLMQ